MAGVALAVAALAAWVWVAGRGARGGDLAPRGGPHVVEGEPLSVRADRARATGLPGRRDRGGPARAPRAGAPGAGGRTQVRIEVRFERRGPRRLPRPRAGAARPAGRGAPRAAGPAPRRSAGAAADRAGGVAQAGQPAARGAERPARARATAREWTSTGCAPTARARRPRGSTGRRTRAAPACWSAGWRPRPDARRAGGARPRRRRRGRAPGRRGAGGGLAVPGPGAPRRLLAAGRRRAPAAAGGRPRRLAGGVGDPGPGDRPAAADAGRRRVRAGARLPGHARGRRAGCRRHWPGAASWWWRRVAGGRRTGARCWRSRAAPAARSLPGRAGRRERRAPGRAGAAGGVGGAALGAPGGAGGQRAHAGGAGGGAGLRAGAARAARALGGVPRRDRAGAGRRAGGAWWRPGCRSRCWLPARWGELALELGRGAQALAELRVPYGGADPWPRLAILAGGALGLLAAGLLSAAGRRRHRGRRRRSDRPLRGARRGADRAGAAAARRRVRAGARRLPVGRAHRAPRPPAGHGQRLRGGAGGLGAAARLDRERPWLDYEAIAAALGSSEGVAFDFDHRYGPLDWPRDGRELLRVRTAERAYWKAADLDRFDGARWVRSRERFGATLSDELPAALPGAPGRGTSACRSRCARCAPSTWSRPARR